MLPRPTTILNSVVCYFTTYYLKAQGNDKSWNVWCKTIQAENFGDDYPSDSKELYFNITESSSQKRTYKRTSVFMDILEEDLFP